MLIGVRHRVGHIQIVLDAPFDCVSGYALCVISRRPVNDALAARVSTQPKHCVVQLGYGVPRSATNFVERALDRGQREIRVACVVPDFGAVRTKHPTFAVVDHYADDAVRTAFGAGKIERVNLRAVKDLRHPNALAVWLVKYEIAVQIPDRRRAGEIRVHDLRECVCAFVVNESVRVARKEYLRPVVRDGHRAGARHVAQLYGRGGQTRQLVDFGARHDVKVFVVYLMRPQATDRACADFLLEQQPRCPVEERRHDAAFRYSLREKVDHSVGGGVDAAGDIRRPKDRRLHQ